MKEKKNWLGKVVLLIAVIAAVAVYFLVPGVNKMMNKVFAMFAAETFRLYVILWHLMEHMRL